MLAAAPAHYQSGGARRAWQGLSIGRGIWSSAARRAPRHISPWGMCTAMRGMLEEATQECDTALTLDPGNYQFRSCAWAFMELGRFERALDFIHLDAGSEWATYVTPSLLLRRRQDGGGARSCETHVDHSSLPSRSFGSLPRAPACLRTRPHGTRCGNQPTF